MLPASALQKLQAEVSELLTDQGSLQVLPDLTGGRAVFNTNAPEGKMPEIFGETGCVLHRRLRARDARSVKTTRDPSRSRSHARMSVCMRNGNT